MQQVITISPDGAISGLQHKKGRGLDLRQFGKAKIERASHIIWCDAAQRWQVEILTGPLAGQIITHKVWAEVMGAELPEGADVLPAGASTDSPLGFDDYDDGVKAEIAILDTLRVGGKF